MKIKELIIGAVGGIVGGYFLHNWLKSRKKQNFAGLGSEESVKADEQTVQFTITNNSDSSQQINLFDSYINYVNPNVSISPSMQTFNTYLPVQPMKVKSIQIQSQGKIQATPPPTTPTPTTPTPALPDGWTQELCLKYAEAFNLTDGDCSKLPPIPKGTTVEEYLKYAEAVGLTQSNVASFSGYNSSNFYNFGGLVKDEQNAQANQPFQKVCIDASGNESKESITPSISPMQAQSGNTIIKPKNLILDGKCYLTYTILPKQYLFITMTYKEYEIK
jgi:hypothetical protein